MSTTESTTDEIIGHTINSLVDKGTITPKDASKASGSSLDELVIRKAPNRPDFLENTDKIRRLLKSELVENALSEEERSELVRKIVLSLTRVLDTYQYGADSENPPKLLGFVIFGSLVNPEKIATKGSDLDIVAVGDNIGQGMLSMAIEDSLRKEKVQIGGVVDCHVPRAITYDGMIDILKLDDKEPLEYWIQTNNQGVVCVGKLPTPKGLLEGDEASKYLREFMNSPEMVQARQRHLEKMEKAIY